MTDIVIRNVRFQLFPKFGSMSKNWDDAEFIEIFMVLKTWWSGLQFTYKKAEKRTLEEMRGMPQRDTLYCVENGTEHRICLRKERSIIQIRDRTIYLEGAIWRESWVELYLT